MPEIPQKLQDYTWQLPTMSPADYALKYCDHVRGITGVLGVWALPHKTTMDIYTLIDPDRELERRLHDAELAFFDEVGDAPVSIYIYSDRDALSYYTKGAKSLLSAR